MSQIIYGNCGGVRGTQASPHALHNVHDVYAQGKTRKNITMKIIGHYKSDQNAKRSKTTENVQKNYENEKRNRKRSTTPIHNNAKVKGGESRRKEVRTA